MTTADILITNARVLTMDPATRWLFVQVDPGAAQAWRKEPYFGQLRRWAAAGDRPVIALAIKWCEDHLPAPADPVLVHGDYRMGNIMVDADGLATVLDWELAHLGDAHEDLAFGCMTVWRCGMPGSNW